MQLPDKKDREIAKDARRFPSRLSATDLPLLNARLAELFYQLGIGAEAFLKSDYGGRSGSIKAISCLKQFANYFEPVAVNGLTQSLVVIENALLALDLNNVLPPLAAKKRAGRAPASMMNTVVRAKAVVATEQLVLLGLPLRDAYQRVAKTLAASGFKAGRGTSAITKHTVRGWKESVGKDVLDEKYLSQLVNVFRAMTPPDRLQKMTKAKAMEYLLGTMTYSLTSARTNEIL